MLGQRIIESYADLENESSSSSFLQPEPYTGLTIRRIKSAGLRVVTESETSSPEVLQDDTNTVQPHNVRRSYLSVRTPDTSHTFGFPNPSMLASERTPSSLSASTPSSASTEFLSARRLSRYAREESALQSAVEASASEVSPQELQIRVLEQATAILSEQARDAQVYAERLRAYLADKELSPEEYRSLQRERWLVEHKSGSRHAQSVRMRDMLVKLSSPVEAEAPLFASPSAMTRREANLVRFLQKSPTRVCLPQTRSSTVSPVLYRRKTISQPQPMCLRASAMELALRSPLRIHSRSKSLDGGHSRSNSESTDATFVSQDSNGQTVVGRSPASQPKLSLRISSPPPFPEGDGTISIETLKTLRPRDELLAEVGDIALPEYAVGLLEELVSTSLDISLQEISAVESTPAIRIGFPPAVSSDTIDDEPSTPPRISTRLRSQSDIPSSSSTPHPQGNARRRSALPRSPFRQSLHVPIFSSLRLSSPSLVPVPESTAPGDRSRPHSSMSGRYVLDSSSAFREPVDEEESATRTVHDTDHRRFSVVSFRRLERAGSSSGSVLARFKRRFSALAQ